jgi:hypothetical protein
MWIGLFIALLVLWVILKLAAGVTSLAIHVLLVFAVISLILHFVFGSRRTT